MVNYRVSTIELERIVQRFALVKWTVILHFILL